MGRKDKSKQAAEVSVLSPQEVRAQAKDFIRSTKNGKKWKCLEESVRSEDMRREQFFNRQVAQNTRVLPEVIEKFLSTLKRSVHLTMRHSGGTPFSIVRQMFMHWDTEKRGALNPNDLDKVMKSLGVALSEKDRNVIFDFYCDGKNSHEMHYHKLLEDIQKGEPSMLAVVNDKNDTEATKGFATQADSFTIIPPLVKNFIAALQSVIAKILRTEGGTAYSVLRSTFMRYDSTHSSALNAEDFKNAMNQAMGLSVTMEQAQAIVKFYDRSFKGEFDYKLLLQDVCAGLPSLVAHKEVSQEETSRASDALISNPFIRRQFEAAPNAFLDSFKKQLRHFVEIKLRAQGGSMKSLLHEAFTSWDPTLEGCIDNVDALRGAIKRLGYNISDEEGCSLIRSYDRDHTGAFHYKYFIQDMVRLEPNLMTDTTPMTKKSLKHLPGLAPVKTAMLNPVRVETAPPAVILNAMYRFRIAVESFIRKSKGSLKAQDVLCGTFMRFDPSGRVGLEQLKEVCRALKVKQLSSSDYPALITYFDTNGTNQLDYRGFMKKIFEKPADGDDDVMMTRSSTNLLAPLSQTVTGSKPVPIKPSTNTSLLGTDDGSPKKEVRKNGKPQNQERKHILMEKQKVESRLASIEKQRKALVDAYRSSHC